MANAEHIEKLKEGVGPWNRWRKDHPKVDPNLSGANLSGFNLDGADFTMTRLPYAAFRETSLRGADFETADLRGADFGKARIVRAFFTGADLTKAHFCGADLQEATLKKASLRGAGLSEVNLVGADLREADLSEADLGLSNLDGVHVGSTTFGDNDLSEVIGLASARHAGPSTIGLNTIYRSKGKIPELFLRGCGVPETFITYMASLVASSRPIEFHSCFISHSSKDYDFAKALHSKLRAEAVPCWFAPEDLKIGDRFQEQIDKSIGIYDKLLVVMSENSIDSTWVQWEVRRALKKEQEQGLTALFPVRLDDAVLEAPYDWAGEVRKRHIGDFRKWKDHDSFQKSLDRLLRDLKAQDSSKPK
jgi:hypothetical protein